MTEDVEFRRRTLVKTIASSALIPLLGGNMIGCSYGSDRPHAEKVVAPAPYVDADFFHGVASGDPLADRVMLWTRVTPESEGDVAIQWEIATDTEFTMTVASGDGFSNASVDYTVKVDAQGLSPNTRYYYRFRVGNNTSPIGITKTAAVGANATASFAVVSCVNYPAGFFNVYRVVARQKVDAVVHLGDYLYEFGQGGYATERAEEFNRVPQPPHDCLTLSDYRKRYAQYRSDQDLQAAHAAHPFILIWDDHEIANDTWREGAENHASATQGLFSERKAAAIQAWYEWLPVRPPASEQEIIYRALPYGDLVDLLMLDTRVVARDKQHSYSDLSSGGSIDVEGTRAAINDSSRAMLGGDQMAWLKDKISSSQARWQVLGQQVLMGRIHLPASVIEALDPSLAGDNSLAKAAAVLRASVEAKHTAEKARTPEQQALLNSAVPYNLDAWDGYNAERQDLLSFGQQAGARIVTLAGDSHNAWSSQLTTDDGAIAGVEFATPSVTSPGIESILGEDFAAGLSPLLLALVDDLRYNDLIRRGYLTVQFTMESVTATWRYVSTVDSREYTLLDENFKQSTVLAADMVLT